MTELVRRDTDSWVDVMAPSSALAGDLCDTDFVPSSMRGNRPAVLAAILTGRELGIGPMHALRHIFIVKGKPGQTAELMRALALAAGHEIDVTEATDTRAVVRGRRAGSTTWQEATFTADQARHAKIDLGGYPQDKLVARASARLCRRLFPDAIGGLPTVDELADGVDPDEPTSIDASVPAPVAKRTVARKSAQPTAQPVQAVTPAQRTAAPAAMRPEPPLPGEEDDDGIVDAEVVPTPDDALDSVTRPQLTKLSIQLKEIGVEDRETRLRVASALAGRQVGSATELSKAEASDVIESLALYSGEDDPKAVLLRTVEGIEAQTQADEQVAFEASQAGAE